jgi:hypothetical protein
MASIGLTMTDNLSYSGLWYSNNHERTGNFGWNLRAVAVVLNALRLQ